MAQLWGLQLPDDAMTVPAGIVDDELDRVEALGHAVASGTPTAQQLDQLGAQRAVKALLEAHADVAALASRETEPVVMTDRDAHASHVRPAAS